MIKRIISLFVVFMLVLSVLGGCASGSRKETASQSAGYNAVAPAEKMKADGVAADTAVEAAAAEEPKMAEGENGATAITGSGVASESINNAILAQRKVIRNANITVEVEDFDVTYGKINSFILGIGYISESNISTDRVYVESVLKPVKRGVIVIRVDKDKFEKVLNDVKGLGEVLNESTGSEDVTHKYYDIESRLRLLKYEEGRLEEYLKKLDDPDKIFKTESRLTDIRHEIEGLTGTLRKLDDLVELSTITLNINEKVPGGGQPPKPAGYGQRLLDNLKDSTRGVISFCGEMFMLVVQAIPVLLLLGVIIIIVLAIYRRIGKNVLPKKDKDKDSQI